MKITGVILAGGQGRRMGGADKGLIAFNGKPMVQHVIEGLRPQVNELLINANRELTQYLSFGYPVFEDSISGFVGPLAGLHCGMQQAQHAYVLSVPCDAPLLPTNLAVRMLNELIAKDADIAVAKANGQSQPVFCLCRKNQLASLEKFLNNGGRKVDAWQRTLSVAEVSFEDNSQAFSNINTPEDLAELEKAA